MTWVVATPSHFGYAAALSDVRVTFADGSERDCLQKIYPVGRSIAMAFSGSVAIGFAMVERISELLQCDEGSAWDPDVVADWWTSDACEVFDAARSAEKRLGCEVVLLGAHPIETNGLFARTTVYVFRSPAFSPIPSLDVVSIGKGSSIKTYSETLDRLANDQRLMSWNTLPSGPILAYDLAMSSVVDSLPIPGISSHFHVCFVFRDRIEIRPNDRIYIGSTEPPFKMPPVARSYSEFKSLSGASATQVTAALARGTGNTGKA